MPRTMAYVGFAVHARSRVAVRPLLRPRAARRLEWQPALACRLSARCRLGLAPAASGSARACPSWPACLPRSCDSASRPRVAKATVRTTVPSPTPALSLGRESMRAKLGELALPASTASSSPRPGGELVRRRRWAGYPGRGQAAGRAPSGTAHGGFSLAQCATRRPLTAGITGAGRSWTACTISVLSIPRKYTDVTPRSACPNWSCMTTSGTPSPTSLQREHASADVARSAGASRLRSRHRAAGHGLCPLSTVVRESGRAGRRTARRAASPYGVRSMDRTVPYSDVGMSRTIPMRWLCRLEVTGSCCVGIRAVEVGIIRGSPRNASRASGGW
jgi:hypothetical protein